MKTHVTRFAWKLNLSLQSLKIIIKILISILYNFSAKPICPASIPSVGAIQHSAFCILLYLMTFTTFLVPSVISITKMFTPWNGVALSIPAALM